MEAWARAVVDDTRQKMTSQLEENVEKAAEGSQKVFALAALRTCRVLWDDLYNNIPVMPRVDPSHVPEEQFQNMVHLNLSLRAQLKEANRIARQVYKIVIGPISSTARTLDTVFAALEDGVKQVRKEMFVLQHGDGDDTEFDEISFSIRDFLQLADFKMSHAAKRIFEVETNSANSADGSGIDWEFRMQELTRDLQAQLQRQIRTADVEKAQAADALRQLRGELDDMRQGHQEQLANLRATHDKQTATMRTAFETDVRDLSGELSRRLQDLQITFVHKLGEFRDLDAESKAICIRALQQVLVAERAKIETKATELGNADASVDRQVARYVGETAVYEEFDDSHNPWEGESHETLVRLLKGKRAELEVLQQSFNVQSRLKNMEWESNLRDVMRQYEEELGRIREKMKHLEAEAEHAAKLVTIRMQETAEARAELQASQRHMHDELHKQRQKYDAEISTLNQDLSKLAEKYNFSAQTVSTQAKQLSDLNSYKNELLNEIEEFHVSEGKLKDQISKMKMIVPTTDAEVQVQFGSGSASQKRRPLDTTADSKSAGGIISGAVRQVLNGKRRKSLSAASSSDGELDPNVQHVGAPSGGSSPQSNNSLALPPVTAHSRRDSLMQQYYYGRGGRDASADSSRSISPALPTEKTVDKAMRGISQTQVALSEQAALASASSTVAEDMPNLNKRRKSKFSAWYEEQNKKKRQDDDGSATSPTSPAKASNPATRFGKRSTPHEHELEKDWMTETLDPNYLAKLLVQDEGDAKVLSSDELGPRTIEALKNAWTSPIDIPDDAVPRLVNEPNFYRLVCKMAVALEFASSTPQQHTQSPFIKRLQFLLPNSEAFLNTSQVKPVVLLDLTCMLQFLECYWQPRLEKIRQNTSVLDGQMSQVKQASSKLASAVQLLRNAGPPRIVSDVPLEILSDYARSEAMSLGREDRPGSGHAAHALQAKKHPPLRSVNPSELKGMLPHLVHVVGFMLTTGRAYSKNLATEVNAVSSHPLTPVRPEKTPSLYRYANDAPTTAKGDAMITVSNLRLHAHPPAAAISHLVDAHQVKSQTQMLRKSSAALLRQRGTTVDSAGSGGSGSTGGTMMAMGRATAMSAR